ncbi:unnamed protein product [Acanthoscelides obtectus]|uniref:THAP9-like helix-turn-helix domain-containing protein n=1 Tax=Acanthoscelides obtectus TaxID=200917 RepID=A0A9P0KQ60_ACAOB|nr:unnamed protein product [Acanthoscelides obtectus]CAK1656528.1 hypothetical protein AOBTE_LOCUS19775 [Acanthoscelides obtectus]
MMHAYILFLQESLPETQKQLPSRQLKKGKPNKYSPELRCFALTLNFYSLSAYNYVRKIFGKNVLPHPRTQNGIGLWMVHLDIVLSNLRWMLIDKRENSLLVP